MFPADVTLFDQKPAGHHHRIPNWLSDSPTPDQGEQGGNPHPRASNLAQRANAESESCIDLFVDIRDATRLWPTLGEEARTLFGCTHVHQENGWEVLPPRALTELLNVAAAERSAEMPKEDHQRGRSVDVLAERRSSKVRTLYVQRQDAVRDLATACHVIHRGPL